MKLRKMISRMSTLAACSALMLVATSSKKQTTIFLIGDSTMANKDIKKGPERGWGMALQGFFTEDVRVDNHALNGRSSRSFILEGHWQKVVDAMKPGDYLIIQFGHNDEKGTIGDRRHTDAGLTFDDNYRMFIRTAKAHGVQPIVMNCVVRRNFYRKPDLTTDDESLRDRAYKEEKVNSDTLIDTHGNYRLTPANVARDMRVPFIDANKLTGDLENSLGIEGSRNLHMWIKPGEYGIAKGRQDNTHYNIYGAHQVASIFVDEIARVCPELKKSVRHYDYIVSARGFGNYLSLQKAVDAAPDGSTICVLDGEWPAPDMQGKNIKFASFSEVKINK